MAPLRLRVVCVAMWCVCAPPHSSPSAPLAGEAHAATTTPPLPSNSSHSLTPALTAGPPPLLFPLTHPLLSVCEQACALLRGGVSAGGLAPAQGRMQEAQGTGGGQDSGCDCRDGGGGGVGLVFTKIWHRKWKWGKGLTEEIDEEEEEEEMMGVECDGRKEEKCCI